MRCFRGGLVAVATAALLLAVLAGICSADRAITIGRCGPNGCPPQIGRQPAPQQTAKAHPATCRIQNKLARAACYGSGTLVDKDQRFGLVVTCQHMFREGTGTITCTFADGQQAKADLLCADPAWDLAALLVRAPNAEPIEVAATAPRAGEIVLSSGYGPDGTYWANRGSVKGYVRTQATRTSETLEITGRARGGDSGGPMLNAKGELVGVLWGTDGRSVGGTYCVRVDKFLLTAGRYLSPYRKGVDNRLDGIERQVDGIANRPPVQIPVPQQPAAPNCPIVNLTPIETRIDRIEARLQTIEDTARQIAPEVPALEKALDELAGKQAATDGKADAAQTAVAVATGEGEGGLFSRLKARIETVKEEGIRAALTGLAWPWGAIAGVVLFLVYRDIRAKIATGDPLLVEKVAERVQQRLGPVRERIIERVGDVRERVRSRLHPEEPEEG